MCVLQRVIIVFTLLAVSLVLPVAAVPALAADHKVVFDCNKSAYPDIRKKIYEQDKAFFNEMKSSTLSGDRNGDYCLTLFDLNDDGIPDILRYADFPSFCGSGGCKFDILMVNSNGSWTKIDPGLVLRPGAMVIVDRKVNGYHVLKTGERGILWVYDSGKRNYVMRQ